jgi:hypothetical protein
MLPVKAFTLAASSQAPVSLSRSARYLDCARSEVKRKSRMAQSAQPLHLGDRHTPTESLTATKRRPCLWITKGCLGEWNAKT